MWVFSGRISANEVIHSQALLCQTSNLLHWHQKGGSKIDTRTCLSPALYSQESLSYLQNKVQIPWPGLQGPSPWGPLSPATDLQHTLQAPGIFNCRPVPGYRTPLHQLLPLSGASVSSRSCSVWHTVFHSSRVFNWPFLSGHLLLPQQSVSLCLDTLRDAFTFSCRIFSLFLSLDDGLFDQRWCLSWQLSGS